MQTFFEQAQSRLKTSTRPFQFRVRFFSQSRWKLNRTETWIAVNDNWISVNVVYVRDSELISSSRFFIQGVVWWWFCAGCVILNCKWAYFFEVKTTRKLDQQWFNQKKGFSWNVGLHSSFGWCTCLSKRVSNNGITFIHCWQGVKGVCMQMRSISRLTVSRSRAHNVWKLMTAVKHFTVIAEFQQHFYAECKYEMSMNSMVINLWTTMLHWSNEIYGSNEWRSRILRNLSNVYLPQFFISSQTLSNYESRRLQKSNAFTINEVRSINEVRVERIT